MFCTLETYNNLVEAGFPPKQAEAIVYAIRSAMGDLSIKAELEMIRDHLVRLESAIKSV